MGEASVTVSLLLLSAIVMGFTFLLAFTGYAWLVEKIFHLAGAGISLAFTAFIIYLLYCMVRGLFRELAAGVRRLFTPSVSSRTHMQQNGASTATAPDSGRPARPQRPPRPRNIVRRPPPRPEA